MRRAALLFTGFALLAAVAAGGEGDVRRSSRRIPGRYIVVLTPNADTVSVADTVRNLKGARIRHTYERGVKGFALETSDVDAQTLSGDPRVQFIEEDSSVSVATSSWALDRVDQRSLPLDGSYLNEGSGAGVTVYVVDTGIRAEHVDFGGRVVSGFNAFADNAGTSDCNGHGTHVAGLAGGSKFGVARSATLVAVRVLDCSGAGSISTVLAGLDWILETHAQSPRPSVVNMSLAGGGSAALDSAVNELIAAGLTTVVAAGNSNEDACRVSPARVPAAVTVGASTETDERASFSNYGACVDLFAPGTNVLSDWYGSPTATAISNGTSAAAPLVAGVAALWLEKYPQASPGAVSQTVASEATSGVLSGLDGSSPNRLLYSSIGALGEAGELPAQLLGDPGFEYGTTFWSSDICSVVNPAGCTGLIESIDYFGLMSFASRSGNGRAAIGGKASTFNLTSEAVTIPSSVRRAELSVYLWIVTKNKKSSADDVLNVEIRDAAGALLETLATYSNRDANQTYTRRSFDVTRYRGATVRISFSGVQTNGPPTWFVLDDATLNTWD